MVQTIEGIWTVFAANFLQFWDEAILSGKGGDLIHPAIFPPKASGAGSAAKVRHLFVEVCQQWHLIADMHARVCAELE